MSWDSYLDNIVQQSKDGSGTCHVDRACIIGKDGGAPWTTAAHGSVRITEPHTLVPYYYNKLITRVSEDKSLCSTEILNTHSKSCLKSTVYS